MKFCVNYKKDFKYLNEIDELTIRFRRQDTSLVDFLLLYPNKRINITIEDETDFIKNDCIKLFDAIAAENNINNFTFKLKHFSEDIINIIKSSKMKYKFFFDAFVNDWDTLRGYAKLNPSDIYIVESLGFELAAVAKFLHENNIRVRVFPNVAQSSWNGTEALKNFFIRPDDVYVYEPYVDVMEFFDKEDSIATYYKIYAIDKKWFGKLKEVIIGFENNDIDSRYILPSFASRRLNCGKRCLKGRSCRICEETEILSSTLEQNHIMFTNFEKN